MKDEQIQTWDKSHNRAGIPKETTRFIINDQEFELMIRFVGGKELQLVDVHFARIIDEKRIHAATRASGMSMFGVFTAIKTHCIEWWNQNKEDVKAVVIGPTPLSSVQLGKSTGVALRLRGYDKGVANSARALGYKIHQFTHQPKKGNMRFGYLLYDAEYLKSNPLYTAKLNGVLKKRYNIVYGRVKNETPT